MSCTSPGQPLSAPVKDPRVLHALAQTGLAMPDCIKIGRLGAGAGTTNQIRLRWRTSEVGRIGPCISGPPLQERQDKVCWQPHP